MFSLCEVSGYLWNGLVYVGKDAVKANEHKELAKNLGKSGAVVPKLMSDLFDKGHHLYNDNWYTSEELLDFLRDRDTLACEPAMGNRIKAKSLKDQPLEKGEWAFRRNDNLLTVKYEDKKEILFLSTIHDIQTERLPNREWDELAPSKLKLVNDYNAVDTLTGNYTCVRKSFKWTVKVAIHYVEEAVLNSLILYDKINSNKMRFINFKLDVIEKIIIGVNRQNAPTIFSHPAIGRHVLELIPQSEKKENQQKRCQICHKEGRRKETRYQCKSCPTHPGLCPSPCFEKFHLKWKFCRFSKALKGNKIDIKDEFFTVDLFFLLCYLQNEMVFSGYTQHNSIFYIRHWYTEQTPRGTR